MGKAVERLALLRKHEILASVDGQSLGTLNSSVIDAADVAIEFTEPESALNNISFCIEHNIPVVSGTTGWLENKYIADEKCRALKGTFFHSSNFSIGMNLMMHINRYMGKLVANYAEYTPNIEEVHHTEKKDSPSGSAIVLANGILEFDKQLNKWVNNTENADDELLITSVRTPGVPGTHIVSWNSAIDSLQIKHIAHNREGFAHGAVLAAEFVQGKQGIFGMQDLLNFPAV